MYSHRTHCSDRRALSPEARLRAGPKAPKGHELGQKAHFLSWGRIEKGNAHGQGPHVGDTAVRGGPDLTKAGAGAATNNSFADNPSSMIVHRLFGPIKHQTVAGTDANGHDRQSGN